MACRKRVLDRRAEPTRGMTISCWRAGRPASNCAAPRVKSIRLGKCTLKDCYAAVKDGELFVYGMHISPYEKGSFSNTDPLRPAAC